MKFIRKRVVAIMDTMWDWRSMTSGAGYRQAPKFFIINKNNFSGKRLYRILGGFGRCQFFCTESCKELATHAKQHGTPDPGWLAGNLKLLEPIHVLLVCGQVAQKTFKASGHKTQAKVFEMMHPAARGWTKEIEEELKERVQKCLLLSSSQAT